MITLISFGYLHLDNGVPPRADRVEDVRDRLRDPSAMKDIDLIDLTGLDFRVRQVVARTAGARGLLDDLFEYTLSYPHPLRTRIAIGCVGGRHRSVALVQMLATRLRRDGVSVEVEHLHVDRPVVRREQAGATP